MSRVSYLAVTVVGHDRPGIIAQSAAALAAVGMNLEDSSMTLLRGHFAMTLICAGEASTDEVVAHFAELRADGLDVTVRDIPPDEELPPVGPSYLLTVHGADRLGIVARLSTVLADHGGNITDLTTRMSGDLYVLTAEVDVPPELALPDLQAELAAAATELGVEAALRPLERDEL
jgi:glycine cleavage system transcriptional repressor